MIVKCGKARTQSNRACNKEEDLRETPEDPALRSVELRAACNEVGLKMYMRHRMFNKSTKRMKTFYSCQMTGCNKSFEKKSSCITHLNVHTKSRPYFCQYCGASFSQSGTRNRHVNLKHFWLKKTEMLSMVWEFIDHRFQDLSQNLAVKHIDVTLMNLNTQSYRNCSGKDMAIRLSLRFPKTSKILL